MKEENNKNLPASAYKNDELKHVVLEAEEDDCGGFKRLFLQLHEPTSLWKNNKRLKRFLRESKASEDSFILIVNNSKRLSLEQGNVKQKGIIEAEQTSKPEKTEIVGSITISIVDNLTYQGRPIALIENVIVDESYRRQGVATALFEEAIKIAKSKNCHKVELISSNHRTFSHSFYERFGFTEHKGFRLRLPTT